MLYCAALVVPIPDRRLGLGFRAPFVVAVIGTLLVLAHPAAAQVIGSPRPIPVSESVLGFLTRFDAHLNAARISGDGESQFKWDTDIGVDMDVFDLDFVRGNVFINVETMNAVRSTRTRARTRSIFQFLRGCHEVSSGRRFITSRAISPIVRTPVRRHGTCSGCRTATVSVLAPSRSRLLVGGSA